MENAEIKYKQYIKSGDTCAEGYYGKINWLEAENKKKTFSNYGRPSMRKDVYRWHFR